MKKRFQLLLKLFVVSLIVPTAFADKPFATLQWETKNGAHVVFYQAMEVPMLDISIAFAAGSAYDGDAFGLSSLTTRLLNQGNAGLDANSVAEKLEETGAQFEAANNRDMVVLNLKTLTKTDALKQAFQIFTSILTHPDFLEAEFIQEKEQQLMSILQSQESPDEIANQAFYQILYKNHPYAHPIIGDRAHVEQLKLEQVRNFYNHFFVSNNAIIVLVGAIDLAKAHQLAEQLTADLPRGQPAAPVPLALPLTEASDVEVPFRSTQTILRLGQLGIRHDNPHYFPLIVGNYILGGGSLVSRLAEELREKKGFTYNVSSQFSPMPGRGPFLIGLSTKTNQKKIALEMIRSTLATFIKSGPNEQELEAAKQYLKGSFPLSLGSNRSIADMLLKLAFYHLPENYLQTYVEHIDAVTTNDIKTAFQDLLIPNKLLQVSVGKEG